MNEPADHIKFRLLTYYIADQSWLGEFGQVGKWSFCLTAARMAREQERR
jgi:hypothetical protein